MTSIFNSELPRTTWTQKVCLIISILGLVGLFINSLIDKKFPIFDEHFYIEEVQLLNAKGISFDFLKSSKVAVGPLTAIIHFFLEPLTNINVPGIRLVNPLFLLLIIFIFSLMLRYSGSANPIYAALGIISIPMIWPLSGMVLTEIPAMLFAYTGILLLLLSIDTRSIVKGKFWESIQYNDLFSLLIASLAGFIFSLSILGRQTFLIVLLAVPVLAMNNQRARKCVVVFLIVSIILPAITFITWGGLVPPLHLMKPGYISNESFSIVNGFLSYAYSTIVIAIAAPQYFNFNKKSRLLIIGFISLGFILNLSFGFVTITPAYSIAQKIFPANLLPIYTHLVSAIFVSLGILFVSSIFRSILENRNDIVFCFMAVSAFLVCSTPFKIVHLFSSRYTAIAIPLLLLIADRYSKDNYWKVLRMGAGVAAGFLILRSFFWAN